jgi:hypothetical protein
MFTVCTAMQRYFASFTGARDPLKFSSTDTTDAMRVRRDHSSEEQTHNRSPSIMARNTYENKGERLEAVVDGYCTCRSVPALSTIL